MYYFRESLIGAIITLIAIYIGTHLVQISGII